MNGGFLKKIYLVISRKFLLSCILFLNSDVLQELNKATFNFYELWPGCFSFLHDFY